MDNSIPDGEAANSHVVIGWNTTLSNFFDSAIDNNKSTTLSSFFDDIVMAAPSCRKEKQECESCSW